MFIDGFAPLAVQENPDFLDVVGSFLLSICTETNTFAVEET